MIAVNPITLKARGRGADYLRMFGIFFSSLEHNKKAHNSVLNYEPVNNEKDLSQDAFCSSVSTASLSVLLLSLLSSFFS